MGHIRDEDTPTESLESGALISPDLSFLPNAAIQLDYRGNSRGW
jgi:hypothetical protein